MDLRTDATDKERNALDLDAQMKRAVIKKAMRMRRMRCALARTDANEFCKFVLRDERTGHPIKQAPMHTRWHELLDEHDRVVFWSHVEGGKTSQIAVGRVLWELGRDPSMRVAIVSNTSDMAQKITRQLGQYIEKSDELHMVFPQLVPTNDPSLPWKSRALTVRRPGVGAKDPTIQACGVHGNILGSRLDYLVLDDVLDHENTHTPGPRSDVVRWVRSTLFSRLTEFARVIVIGNAWHPEDLMHVLEKEPRYKAYRFPVIDPVTSRITWPDRWPRRRIEKAKQDLGPLEYARQLMCQSRDDTSARFKREWIDLCLKRGADHTPHPNIESLFDKDPLEVEGLDRDEVVRAREAIWRMSGGGCVVSGVDLAVQRHEAADLTCIFTLFVHTDGTRQVLHITSGRWTGPEILDQVKDVHARFGGIFVVENNAAQHYIVQFLRDQSAVPVVPFTTGRNRAHPEYGVESLAAEFSGSKWIIPGKRLNSKGRPEAKIDKEVNEWITELLFYDPREHVGDRVMASWFAREGARRYADAIRGGGDGVRVRAFG